MGLADEVTARVSTSTLAQLTNGDTATSGLTINTTVLGYAVLDTISDMKVHAGVSYDGTDDRHVSYGVRGVLCWLRVYKVENGADKLLSAWRKELAELAKVTHNNRVTPRSNSTLQPRPEAEGARPFFDLQAQSDLIPGPANAGPREFGPPGTDPP